MLPNNFLICLHKTRLVIDNYGVFSPFIIEKVAIGNKNHFQVISLMSLIGITKFLYFLSKTSLFVLYVSSSEHKCRTPPIIPLWHKLHENCFPISLYNFIIFLTLQNHYQCSDTNKHASNKGFGSELFV